MLTPKSEASATTLEGYSYSLRTRIHKTRMSEVWLAEETTTGQWVIIKFALIGEDTDPNQRAILNDERWLRRLNHPSIIKILPIQENPPARDPVYRAKALNLPGTPWFIVEPRLVGGSVAEVLKERKKFDLASALRIARHMFAVLVYLRQAGCVHNDMKLANWVFVLKFDPANPDALMWQTMLLDFGIAQTIGEKIFPAKSPGWAAPEVEHAYHAHALITADPSWDVYGAALILQTLLTGQSEPDKEIRPDLDPAKRFTGLHLTRTDLASDSWVSEHDLSVIERTLNQLLERTINGAAFVRPQAEEFVAELDTLLRLIKPKPAWVRSIEPFFQWLIDREFQKTKSLGLSPQGPKWAWAFVTAFLVLLFALAVMFGGPVIGENPGQTPTTGAITTTLTVSATAVISPALAPVAEISSTVVTTPVVTMEQPTATATPEPTPSATATTVPPTDTPTATTALTLTTTAPFTPTPTATATNTEARVPDPPLAPSIPDPVTVTPAPSSSQIVVNQGVVIPQSPPAGAAINIDADTTQREREQEFVWAYLPEFNRGRLCAELIFRYPLHNQNGTEETKVVADVTNQTRHKVDLPGWFHGKNVQQSGFTFKWGVRIFACGSSTRPDPAELREYTLTQQ